MTYEQTVHYLYGIRLFGIKLGLDNVRALLAWMGNPQKSLRFIHIAGTNGKGSVAAMLSAIAQKAGLRTGLYTSPHLVSFCERIRVNGRAITEADVVRLVGEIRPLMEQVGGMPEHAHPTFFEAVTAMALRYFQEQQCELVVWETGMGGRLDATNVVTPLVSVITNVQFDHAAYLGETIEKIAAEKAGIIKPGVPVVTAADDGTAMEVIERAADEAQAPLTRTRPADAEVLNTDLRGQTVSVGGTPFWIPLLGAHQARNTAVAVAVARLALRCSDETIRIGLAATEWPGRFHVLPGKPTLVLDGAHNPAAARALADTLGTHFAGKRVALVLGILQDKDCAEFCRILAPRASEVLTVRVANDRASDPAELAALCQRLAPQAAVRNAKTLGGALAETRGRDGIVVVTGSLFLVGEALALARGSRLESVLNQ